MIAPVKRLDRIQEGFAESLFEGMGRPERRRAMAWYLEGMLLDSRPARRRVGRRRGDATAPAAPELPPGMYLARSEPANWEDITVLPGWTCTWAAFEAVPNVNFGANAEIRCFAIGHTP